MIDTHINKEKLLADLQNEIAEILQISIFDVEEISDESLNLLISIITSIPNRYAMSLAQKQEENEVIYMNLKELDPTLFSERLIKMHKEQNET